MVNEDSFAGDGTMVSKAGETATRLRSPAAVPATTPISLIPLAE
jgi:hypothetical protein